MLQHKSDPLFEEFIEAHINENTTWIKETLEEIKKSDNENSDEEESEILEQQNDSKEELNSEDVTKSEDKVANKQISDLEVTF